MHQPSADEAFARSLPAAHEQVVPRVPWGRHDVLFTPAYWKSQCRLHRPAGQTPDYRIGRTLSEEAAACLLGGHGVASAVGLAAFRHLRDRGLLDEEREPAVAELAGALAEPLRLGTRSVRYRFPRARAASVAAALIHVRRTRPADDSHAAFRTWLLKIRGVGMKTASWITRNWLGSTSVAILDIHVYRAGLIAGFFRPHLTVQSHYLVLERAFLEFCSALGEDAAHLDAIMWRQMKDSGDVAHRTLADALKRLNRSGRLGRAA